MVLYNEIIKNNFELEKIVFVEKYEKIYWLAPGMRK